MFAVLPSALAFLDILDISGWMRVVVAQLVKASCSEDKKDAEMTQVRTSVVHRYFFFTCILLINKISLIKSMFAAPNKLSKYFFSAKIPVNFNFVFFGRTRFNNHLI